MQNLIIYSTTDGQTISIAEKIGEVLEDTKVVSIADSKTLNLNDFETIVIGASIRYGKHKPELYKFIKDNLDVLGTKKNAFFSVNVVARKPEKIHLIQIHICRNFLSYPNGVQRILVCLLGRLITLSISL